MARLVLDRKMNESIMVGDEVKITVADVCGTRVKLLVEAPDHIKVHRQEVYEAIHKERDTDLTCTHEWVRAILPNYKPGEICLKCRAIRYDA